MRALLLAALLAQDGGTPLPPIYHLERPTLVPEGYYLPDESFQKLDDEMRRLQHIEKHPPQLDVTGYMVAVGAALAVGFGAGFAISEFTSKK